MNFFVSEISYENLLKVLWFAYVFESGEKYNVLLCSCLLCVSFLLQNSGFRGKVNFFVSEVSLEILLEVLDFASVFENG